MVDLALKNLLHDKLRFSITVSGVAFAVTLVFVQVGLFLGLMDNADMTIRGFDAELWVTSRNTPNVDFAHAFPDQYVQRVRSVPGVLRADNLIVAFLNVNLPSGAQEGTIAYAMEDFARWGFPSGVAGGELKDLRRGSYFVLDDSATKRYGPFAVGEYREVSNQRMKIIGRTRGIKSFTTTPMSFIDYETVQKLLPETLAGRTTYILVKLAPGADLEAVRRAIRARLPYNDVYTRDEWGRRSRTYWTVNTGLGLNAYLTVFLGCLVGVVVVAQTLYTATMEHLKEFGTVKAIGGGNADIYRILLEQAGIAAVVGFALGMGPAYLLRPVVGHADLKLILPSWLVGAVFAGTVVLCAAAAMVSFRKVARIDPALVFRT